MDLFESGPGSPQVHDFSAEILPSGLFWTVPIPPNGFGFSHRGRRAQLHLRDIPLIDSFVFAGANHAPAEVDISVEWEATGPAEQRGSGNSVPPTDPAAFLGTFRQARATGRFAGIELGFAFRTRVEANSDAGFAELGSERNGVFL